MRSLHRIDEDDYDEPAKPDDGKPRLKDGVDPSTAPQLKEDDRPPRKSEEADVDSGDSDGKDENNKK